MPGGGRIPGGGPCGGWILYIPGGGLVGGGGIPRPLGGPIIP